MVSEENEEMVFKDAFGNGKTSAYSLFYIDCEMK